MQYLKIMKPPHPHLWGFMGIHYLLLCISQTRFLCVFPPYQRLQYQKMMMINGLPNLLPLVWALVARLVSNGCSSLVHHLPIT